MVTSNKTNGSLLNLKANLKKKKKNSFPHKKIKIKIQNVTFFISSPSAGISPALALVFYIPYTGDLSITQSSVTQQLLNSSQI